MRKTALFLRIFLPVSLLICLALFFGCNREQVPPESTPPAVETPQQQENLAAPTDLFLEKDYITSSKTKYTVRFNGVQGADGYIVNPGNKDFEIKETSLDISEFVRAGNIQSIAVKAYKEQDGNRIFSKEITITEKILRITQGVTYSLLEDGTYEVSCQKCTKAQITGTVVFPDRYNGKEITRLADSCLRRIDSGEVVSYVDGKRVVSVRQFINTATTEVIFPKYVTSLGISAFSGCVNFEQIEIPDTVREIGFGCFGGCSKLRSVRIPDGVAEVYGFFGCTELTEVYFPSSVKVISEFNNCPNLTKVEFPPYLESVSGFFNTGLTEVYFPSSVKAISGFFNSPNLTKVEFPPYLESVNGFSDTGLTEVYFPSSVKVVSGFNNCPNLTKVEFSPYLESVNGFSDTGLIEVHLPSSVKTVKGFRDCKNLEKINLENVTEIAYDSFYGSKWFEELPDEFVVIKGILFRYNGEKEELYEYPSGIEEISILCFGGEQGPSTIFLPFFGKKTEVTDFQFSGNGANTHLKHLIIDEGYEVLPRGATDYLKALELIVVPKSMKKMDLYWVLLSSIYYMGTQEEWEKIEIYGKYDAKRVYFYSETQPTEEGNFWHYVNNEIVLW